jgi:hypothetical protein
MGLLLWLLMVTAETFGAECSRGTQLFASEQGVGTVSLSEEYTLFAKPVADVAHCIARCSSQAACQSGVWTASHCVLFNINISAEDKVSHEGSVYFERGDWADALPAQGQHMPPKGKAQGFVLQRVRAEPQGRVLYGWPGWTY